MYGRPPFAKPFVSGGSAASIAAMYPACGGSGDACGPDGICGLAPDQIHDLKRFLNPRGFGRSRCDLFCHQLETACAIASWESLALGAPSIRRQSGSPAFGQEIELILKACFGLWCSRQPALAMSWIR